MAATVTMSESNGVGEDITTSITNSNMGSTDAVNLAAVTYPITAGTNSFEKFQRFRCSADGGSSALLNWKVWASAGLSANCSLKTNARESDYGGATAYVQPSATDRSATYGYTQAMPTSEPTGSNLGYGGTLGASMDITGELPKYSDYLVMQIQTTIAATAGTTVTMNYQYDEVA